MNKLNVHFSEQVRYLIIFESVYSQVICLSINDKL